MRWPYSRLQEAVKSVDSEVPLADAEPMAELVSTLDVRAKAIGFGAGGFFCNR